LLGVQLRHPPAVEELPAPHRVAVVHLPRVVRVDVAHGGGAPALRHDRVRLAEQGLADDGGAHPALPRRDRGPQPGAARPDDEDVVVVVLGLGHHMPPAPRMRKSVIVPAATSATYRSVSTSVPSVTHANSMWRVLSTEIQVHNR